MEKNIFKDVIRTVKTQNVTINRIEEPVNSKIKSKGSVKERLSCFMLGIILYFMDAMTIGTKGLGEIPGMNLAKYSGVFFVVGILASQLAFFSISSFSIGVMATPISENFVTFGKMTEYFYDKNGGNLRGSDLFWTLITFISLCSLLTSIAFLVLYLVGFSEILELMTPTELPDALFIVIGIFCVQYGQDGVTSILTEAKITNESYKYYIILGLFTALLFALWYIANQAKTTYKPIAPFMYFITFLVTVAVAHVAMLVFFNDIDKTRAMKILPTVGQNFSTLFDLPLLAKFEFSNISWSALLSKKSILTMLGVVALNLLQFPINVSMVKKQCHIDAKEEKALLTNSASNFLSSVFGGFFPTYLLSSSTVAFNQNSNITKKIDGVILAVLFAFLYVFGQSVFSFVPQMCLDMLLVFIGFDILKDSIISIWNLGAYAIAYTFCIAIFSLQYENLPIGMAVGLGISALLFFKKCDIIRRDKKLSVAGFVKRCKNTSSIFKLFEQLDREYQHVGSYRPEDANIPLIDDENPLNNV